MHSLLPHLAPADAPAVREVARLLALIERLDECLGDGRMERRDGTPRRLLEHRQKLSKELRDWSDRLGMSPLARSEWAGRLASGGNLGDRIRAILEAEREGGAR